jgi:hypothetical protein
MRNKRINALPWFCKEMALDWSVEPFKNYNKAEGKRASVAGIIVVIMPGAYVVVRRIAKGMYQAWGTAGTYAMALEP